jgi:toxin ParE1/3/4
VSRTILRREAAKRDLINHFVYIGEHHSLDRARRFREAVESSFHLLAENPLIGASRRFANPRYDDIRFWPIRDFREYLVFYRPLPNGVQVERVLHARMDYRRALGPEP